MGCLEQQRVSKISVMMPMGTCIFLLKFHSLRTYLRPPPRPLLHLLPPPTPPLLLLLFPPLHKGLDFDSDTLPIQMLTLPFHYIISFTCCIYFIFSSLLPAFNYVIIILLPFLVICYPFKLFVTKFLKRTLTLTPILTPTLILKNSIIFTKIFIYIIYIIYFSTYLYKPKSTKQSQN